VFWVLVCALGLTVEMLVIIGLGRQVTRPYEEEVAITGPPSGPAAPDRHAVSQRAA